MIFLIIDGAETVIALRIHRNQEQHWMRLNRRFENKIGNWLQRRCSSSSRQCRHWRSMRRTRGNVIEQPEHVQQALNMTWRKNYPRATLLFPNYEIRHHCEWGITVFCTIVCNKGDTKQWQQQSGLRFFITVYRGYSTKHIHCKRKMNGRITRLERVGAQLHNKHTITKKNDGYTIVQYHLRKQNTREAKQGTLLWRLAVNDESSTTHAHHHYYDKWTRKKIERSCCICGNLQSISISVIG